MTVFVESKVGVREGRRPVSVNPSCQLIQLRKKKKCPTRFRESVKKHYAVCPDCYTYRGFIVKIYDKKNDKLLLICNSRQAYTHKQHV